MSAIDPAIGKAAESVSGPSCPDCGHLIGTHSHDVGCMDSMTAGALVRNQLGFCPCERSSLGLIADAVKAARARALQEAADAWQWGEWANGPRCPDRIEERIANAQFVTDWLRARVTALTEAAPHD